MFAARYHDGLVALSHEVTCRLEGRDLVIADTATGEELDRWPADAVFPLHARRNELRIGATDRPYGARLAFDGADTVRAVRALLPALARAERADRGRQARTIGLATAALVSVVVVYLVGVPLLSRHLVNFVPTAWEAELGNTAVAQIAEVLGEKGGFEVCDPNPNSLANRAIARFAARVVEGTGTPFTPDIQVIRSGVPNAFALPGGHSFYFSALLDQTRSADEFAGVMAHELGHVVHRHGMEQLISTSATGLLVGFILGDMTGLSVAGGVGAALVDSRFSREAEREADRFAADTARRLGFRAAGLVDLLERVAGDDGMSEALALLSTHPLTAERRAALEALAAAESKTAVEPAFSPEEWAAIRAMCGAPPPATPASPSVGKTDKNG